MLLLIERVFSLLVIITFVLRVIFGDNPVHWLDWIAGAAFAVSIYNLEPLFGKYLKPKKTSRR